MGDEKGKWSLTENVERNKDAPVQPGVAIERALTGTGVSPAVLSSEHLGALQRIQARSAAGKAALQLAREFYDRRLRAFTHQLDGMLQVANKRTDVTVSTELARIDAEFLEQLRQLDVENYDTRATIQQELLGKTTAQLNRAEEQEAPEFLKKELIESILAQHRRVMNQIGGGTEE